jgi:hypothetical protein
MKKALMLAGLVLCTTAGFAAEIHTDLTTDGRKRNEEAYEKMLEQTGWRSEKVTRQNPSDSQHTSPHISESTQPKSS